MLAKVKSGALMGVDAVAVDVEVDMSMGLPFFNVVGLPEGAVKESKVRVVSALKNCGYHLPQKRVTVNLAPADIRKEGAAFELPIALGVLVASRLLEGKPLEQFLFGGELSLDGAVRPIRGVLPLAIAARNGGFKGVLVPTQNAPEAALVDGIEVIPVSHLTNAVAHLSGEALITPFDRTNNLLGPPSSAADLDMRDVRGQQDIKDALELAAAGGHNVLMCGPPGSGKTMLARRLPSILPPLSAAEALEVTKVYSVLGLLKDGQTLVQRRPFRAPHHTISDAGMVGGGPLARPGELSLAHRGVLFLDELPEFKRHVLEVLRQPMEEGFVSLARAALKMTYPCQVMVVAAMNPCPCGYWKVDAKCTCSETRTRDYHARVSGPMLDRIDITLETRQVDLKHFAGDRSEKPSRWYRDRVIEARNRQAHRFKDETGVMTNAQMGPSGIHVHCKISPAAQHLLVDTIAHHGLSARAHDRILKLARTRADLEGREFISDEDVAVAVECRKVDRRDYLRKPGHTVQQYNAVEQRALMRGGGRR